MNVIIKLHRKRRIRKTRVEKSVNKLSTQPFLIRMNLNDIEYEYLYE
jgi:hypothetical protein